MSDPFRVFRDDPGRQETLKILWPALYECLARLDEPGPPRVLKCGLGVHPLGAGPPAVARIINRFGQPACRPCIDKIYGPGHAGWPLELER